MGLLQRSFWARVATALAILASISWIAEGAKLKRRENFAPVNIYDATFDETIKNGKWLVMFYAPWCGHCKHFGPILDDAAENYFQGSIRVGRVDATSQSGLKSRFDVSSYPRIHYFEDGEQVTLYKGQHNLETLLTFGERMVAGPIRTYEDGKSLQKWLTTSTDERNMERDPVSFVLLSKRPADEEARAAVKQAGHVLRPHMLFAECAKASCWDIFCSGENPADFCKNDEKAVFFRYEPDEAIRVYSGDLANASAVEEWAIVHNVPTFAELTPGSYSLTAQQKDRPLVMAIVDSENPSEEATKFVQEVRTIARGKSSKLSKDIQERFMFSHVDGSKWVEFLEDHNIFRVDLPRVLVIDVSTRVFYEDPDLEGDVEEFLMKIIDEEVSPQSTTILLSIKRVWRMFVRYLPYSAFLLLLVLMVVSMFLYLLCISEFELDEEELADPADKSAAALLAQKSSTESKKTK